ncbi:MAG: hypothetical protein EAY75_03095 [Bacteroidetes bacterium]|nr:MAG: hypothetical protein EAY75_03095 [Bacteroidota bacterium]
MPSNPISAFEYVSILVSIILGLGITQILSAVSTLLLHQKTVKRYWPHTLWVLFISFLHIQDWFITYQLKDKAVWHLPELFFVLLYPIMLFVAAKMLLPDGLQEAHADMKVLYLRQYPAIFFAISLSIAISILFNTFLLRQSLISQWPLALFLGAMLWISIKKPPSELLHKTVALVVTLAALFSVIVERNAWVIK